MWPILIVLIIGLAISFVKIWSLTRSSTNSKKFIIAVKEKLKNGGVPEAMKYLSILRIFAPTILIQQKEISLNNLPTTVFSIRLTI